MLNEVVNGKLEIHTGKADSLYYWDQLEMFSVISRTGKSWESLLEQMIHVFHINSSPHSWLPEIIHRNRPVIPV